MCTTVYRNGTWWRKMYILPKLNIQWWKKNIWYTGRSSLNCFFIKNDKGWSLCNEVEWKGKLCFWGTAEQLVIRKGDSAFFFFNQVGFRSVFQQHTQSFYVRNKCLGKKGPAVKGRVVVHMKESKFQNFLFEIDGAFWYAATEVLLNFVKPIW